jgi:hypothetical protein
MKTGMLCMKRPKTVPQKPRPRSKMSNENIARKRRNIIDRILGIQYMYLLIFFFTGKSYRTRLFKVSGENPP